MPDSTPPNDQSNGSPAEPAPPKRRRLRRNPLWVWIFLVSMIVLAGVGFFFKFSQFFSAYRTGGGMDFAIIPLASYAVVALGFLCFFLWAYFGGMFKDIEDVKFRMLEMQDEFDAMEQEQSS